MNTHCSAECGDAKSGPGEAHGAGAPPAEEFDPWKLLDMHEKGSLLIRPFRQVRAGQAQRCTPCIC